MNAQLQAKLAKSQRTPTSAQYRTITLPRWHYVASLAGALTLAAAVWL